MSDRSDRSTTNTEVGAAGKEVWLELCHCGCIIGSYSRKPLTRFKAGAKFDEPLEMAVVAFLVSFSLCVVIAKDKILI